MSWLRARKAPDVSPDFTGLQLQTSVSTLAIPIVWGITKLSVNVIWYNNFKAVPQYSTSSGKGGKSSSSVSGYSYTADAMMRCARGRSRKSESSGRTNRPTRSPRSA